MHVFRGPPGLELPMNRSTQQLQQPQAWTSQMAAALQSTHGSQPMKVSCEKRTSKRRALLLEERYCAHTGA
eukprot:6310774-Amphidinium_carterae.1